MDNSFTGQSLPGNGSVQGNPKKPLYIILIELLIILIVGCLTYWFIKIYPGSNQRKDNLSSNVPIEKSGFDTAIFRTVHQAEKNNNFLVSPFSITMALELVSGGSSGETQSEIKKALGIEQLTDQQIYDSALNKLNSLKNLDPEVDIAIANAIWAQGGKNLNSQYQKIMRDYYLTDIYQVDFNDPKTLNKINQWTSDNTREKIKKLFDNLNKGTQTVLANAIYFKGDWTVPFKKAQISNRDFYLANGKTIRHSLMHQEKYYQYLEKGDFQAVKLPYSQGKYAMYVFLPKEKAGLNEFIEKLSDSQLQTWIGNMKEKKGEIYLPKFEFNYEVGDFLGTLKSIGIKRAFTTTLSQIDKILEDTYLYISQGKHKTYIKVDETGTEATAVTGLEMKELSVMPQKEDKFSMVVNHPFFLTIQDDQGTNLFMGAVFNPAS